MPFDWSKDEEVAREPRVLVAHAWTRDRTGCAGRTSRPIGCTLGGAVHRRRNADA
jgi:hypothetical protein